MRQLPILLAAAFSLIIPAIAQMQFSLANEKPVYRVGEPIKLTWKLFNGTKRDWVVFKGTMGVRQNFPQIAFRIEAPDDRYNLSLQGDEKATTIAACRLRPGQTLRADFDLAQWMTYLGHRTPPGDYGISATFAHAASDYRMLQGMPVVQCGSTGPTTTAMPSEIWDGTLTAPRITITLR